MTVSRSAVGVGDGELACPVGFGVEEGFSACRKGVAKLGECFYELLDAFLRGFRGSSRLAAIPGGELLCRVEIAETGALTPDLGHGVISVMPLPRG